MQRDLQRAKVKDSDKLKVFEHCSHNSLTQHGLRHRELRYVIFSKQVSKLTLWMGKCSYSYSNNESLLLSTSTHFHYRSSIQKSGYIRLQLLNYWAV